MAFGGARSQKAYERLVKLSEVHPALCSLQLAFYLLICWGSRCLPHVGVIEYHGSRRKDLATVQIVGSDAETAELDGRNKWRC